jgi:hypothetical protein
VKASEFAQLLGQFIEENNAGDLEISFFSGYDEEMDLVPIQPEPFTVDVIGDSQNRFVVIELESKDWHETEYYNKETEAASEGSAHNNEQPQGAYEAPAVQDAIRDETAKTYPAAGPGDHVYRDKVANEERQEQEDMSASWPEGRTL